MILRLWRNACVVRATGENDHKVIYDFWLKLEDKPARSAMGTAAPSRWSRSSAGNPVAPTRRWQSRCGIILPMTISAPTDLKAEILRREVVVHQLVAAVAVERMSF